MTSRALRRVLVQDMGSFLLVVRQIYKKEKGVLGVIKIENHSELF
jgi:hypothetical protein